jgi:DNA-binding transcriptional MerR regulator
MPYNRLSTSKIARVVGCHPNTVRLYEKIGFLSPVERSLKGYRLYTEAHLDQARLARGFMQGGWPGQLIRRSEVSIIKQAAAQDYSAALELAHRHDSLVRLEHEYAETAAAFLERWASGKACDTVEEWTQPLYITQAARLLNITVDMLRNWERSGLISPRRSLVNRYRLYSAAEIDRLRVIRMLRQAGYSLMAILRMLVQLDSGAQPDLRQALDTPRPDEDLCLAADRWLTTLTEQERLAESAIALLEEMVRKYS